MGRHGARRVDDAQTEPPLPLEAPTADARVLDPSPTRGPAEQLDDLCTTARRELRDVRWLVRGGLVGGGLVHGGGDDVVLGDRGERGQLAHQLPGPDRARWTVAGSLRVGGVRAGATAPGHWRSRVSTSRRTSVGDAQEVEGCSDGGTLMTPTMAPRTTVHALFGRDRVHS